MSGSEDMDEITIDEWVSRSQELQERARSIGRSTETQIRQYEDDLKHQSEEAV
jgi:hypothetical protein